ncbi:MAG: polymerase III, subunit gamma and tau protein [Parcubacteria group bacterium GW2011_GWB1_38_8]|nr:MAG: polymerase III, subunit gamma and tau protein [Parcubacteria group bacterium GW2011_GWB1_38_8]OHA95280.1 MAG: DNA polymerase III, subunit gamma and tau [Candidatus Zambryskibacteria bacterium RIFCSPHIGHO2_02_FULL_39_16]
MKKEEKSVGVLYRKYRPKDFKDVIGQNHIVKVLEGAVKFGNVSHAYLFYGPRGTGKTSLARILSREIGTSANDLVEMDAASNRGIDDIREIRESINTLPFESQYKVYIIDEVHMLTKDAWNAFLKTLEEPPQHVIFILATTEFEKVPETVISRCQTFSFKQPNQATLKDFALSVAEKEGVILESDAAELVALLGDGSFRDTHGILEKVLSSTIDPTSLKLRGASKKITRKEIEQVTGAPKNELVKDILEALVEKDLEKGMKAIQKVGEANADMKLFAKLILEQLRLLFLLRLKAGMDDYISEQVSEDDFKFLKTLASKVGPDLTADVLLRFITAYEDSGRTSIPELALELALADSIKS